MLQVENLRAQVGTFSITVPHFSAKAGEITCVVGPSGSGKSTFFHCIAGFVPAIRGRILISDREITNEWPERRKISIVFQRPALFPHLTIFENIAFSLRIQRRPEEEIRSAVEKWLTRFSIDNLSSRLPHQISGGQAQRVALSRALITGFPLLLLDEPFAGLDVIWVRDLRRLLQEIVREAGVVAVWITHDPEDVRMCADKVVVLENGVPVQTGVSNELTQSPKSSFVREFMRSDELVAEH